MYIEYISLFLNVNGLLKIIVGKNINREILYLQVFFYLKAFCSLVFRPKIKYCLFALDLPTHKNCPYPKYFIGISF